MHQAEKAPGISNETKTKRPISNRERTDGDVQVSSQALGYLGEGSLEPIMETYVDLLTDPRLSHPASAPQKGRIVSQLQRRFGNFYVQRVVKLLNVGVPLLQTVQMTPEDDILAVLEEHYTPERRGELRHVFRSVPLSQAASLYRRLSTPHPRRGDELSEQFHRLATPVRDEMLRILREHMEAWEEEQAYEASRRAGEGAPTPAAPPPERPTGEETAGEAERPMSEILSGRIDELRTRLDEFAEMSPVRQLPARHSIAGLLRSLLSLAPGREREVAEHIQASLTAGQRRSLSDIAAVDRRGLRWFSPAEIGPAEGRIRLGDGELELATDIPYIDQSGNLQRGGTLRNGQIAFMTSEGNTERWARINSITPEGMSLTWFTYDTRTRQVTSRRTDSLTAAQVGAELSLQRLHHLRVWQPIAVGVAVISALVLTAGFGVGTLATAAGVEAGSLGVGATVASGAISGALTTLMKESAGAMLQSEDPAHFWREANMGRIVRETIIGAVTGGVGARLGVRPEGAPPLTVPQEVLQHVLLSLARAAQNVLADVVSRSLDVRTVEELRSQYRRAREAGREAECRRIERRIRNRIDSVSEQDFWRNTIRTLVVSLFG